MRQRLSIMGGSRHNRAIFEADGHARERLEKTAQFTSPVAGRIFTFAESRRFCFSSHVRQKTHED